LHYKLFFAGIILSLSNKANYQRHIPQASRPSLTTFPRMPKEVQSPLSNVRARGSRVATHWLLWLYPGWHAPGGCKF